MSKFNKVFDRELYEQNDRIAKQNTIALFENTRFTVRENIANKRGVDLMVYDEYDNHVFNIEVERKTLWKTSYFPYDNVQFPERKEKFAKLTKPTLFIMWNDTWRNFLAITQYDLLSSPRVQVPNKFVRFGELFFQVPIEKVKFNKVEEKVKELLCQLR